jgi:rhamnulokinase
MIALAIDVGASSGRLILSFQEDGRPILKEVYRFQTPLIHNADHFFWDVEGLLREMIAGLKKVKEGGIFPERIGIDTFGVDYALLDDKGVLLAPVSSYRDERTIAAKANFLSPETIFQETGIQPQSFDTVYQLAADQASGILPRAKQLLFLPSYLAYRLTGVLQNERSIVSTSGLFDGRSNDYSPKLLGALHLTKAFFAPLVEAGTCIGPFKKEIADEVGFSAQVYAALEHDTASAFYGSGSKTHEVLISSGTWSLLGSIVGEPIVTSETYQAGFTNELSHKNEVRFLKNVTGMWMVNRLMKESPVSRPIAQVVGMARDGRDYLGYFDATDERLLNPDDMKAELLSLLRERHFALPKNEAELYYSVFHSLARSYALAIQQMSRLTGQNFSAIRIFGGGSKNELLNELTSAESRLPVFRGPVEATALGNIRSIIQL